MKFFRKVRQRLLSENKLSKYLIYAIGEVALVMIGILLALQVNGYNENRKNHKLELNALDELKQDLVKSMVDIDQDLENQVRYLESAWKIQKTLNNSHVFPDSLGNDLVMMTMDAFLFPVSKTYSALKSTGFKTLSNDSIRMLTDRVYELDFPRLVLGTMTEPDIEAYFADYIEENFRAFSTDTLYHQEKRIKDYTNSELYNVGKGNESRYIPLDYNHLRNDPEFSILYVNSMRWRIKKIMKYRTAKDNVKILLRMIENNDRSH